MSLSTLMISAFIVVITITAVTVLAVNRGYAFKHTVDAKPGTNHQQDNKIDEISRH